MKVHIRRPSRDRSFCDEVEAAEGVVSRSIAQLEDRERATCQLCRAAFKVIMYMPRKKNIQRR